MPPVSMWSSTMEATCRLSPAGAKATGDGAGIPGPVGVYILPVRRRSSRGPPGDRVPGHRIRGSWDGSIRRGAFRVSGNFIRMAVAGISMSIFGPSSPLGARRRAGGAARPLPGRRRRSDRAHRRSDLRKRRLGSSPVAPAAGRSRPLAGEVAFQKRNGRIGPAAGDGQQGHAQQGELPRFHGKLPCFGGTAILGLRPQLPPGPQSRDFAGRSDNSVISQSG